MRFLDNAPGAPQNKGKFKKNKMMVEEHKN